MNAVSLIGTGISPAFPVTAEEFINQLVQAITYTNIDGVQPPLLGWQGGFSTAHDRVNSWYPWIDEKIVEPKYDGVNQYLGLPSNQPTHVKDFHMIALMRAVDAVLAPVYQGYMQVGVGSVIPISPPAGPASVG